jgi:hypothetical protein
VPAEIGAAIDLPARACSGHVGELALELPGAGRGQPWAARHAEVGDACGAVDAHQDVLRRDVAMDRFKW